MSYYADKRQLVNQVVQIIKQNKKVKREDLYFYALKTFGFSDRQVDNVINLLIARGIIVPGDDNILEYVISDEK